MTDARPDLCLGIAGCWGSLCRLVGCDDFLAGMLLAEVLKIMDSSDVRPDLCLGIAGCWGEFILVVERGVLFGCEGMFLLELGD